MRNQYGMADIRRIATEIADFEGFKVLIRYAKESAARNGAANLSGYARRHERRARENHTVDDWKRLRFEGDYPGFEVDVLLGDGRVATGKTRLTKVRQSYG